MLIKDLLKTLNVKQQRKIYLLQVLVLLTALLEVFSVTIVGPFMAIVTDKNIIFENSFLYYIYKLVGAEDSTSFLIVCGFFVLVVLFFASALSILTIWKLSKFAAEIGAYYGNSLFSFYINKNYLYHTDNDSSYLIKQIATEVGRVTDNILQPIVQINARIVVVFFIVLMVFIYKPLLAFLGFSILAISYFLIFFLVKKKLFSNGIKITDTSRKRFTLMKEGFSLIKELKINHREDYFVDIFRKTGEVFSHAYGSSNTLYNTPRFIMEFIVYFSMILLVIYLVYSSEGGVNDAIPMISLLGIAVMKLLPSFQQIYSGVAQIRSHISAFYEIKDDLIASKLCMTPQLNSTVLRADDIKFLELNNVFFRYSENMPYILKNISLTISKNSTIGIVGSSGAGKSTLLDLLLGIISPTNGKISISDVPLDSSNMKIWQSYIGYVPQLVILRDTTIAENIALGIPIEKINQQKMEEAARLASLDKWIQLLPEGYLTRVGEAGVKISGGQRQRIAIARALYNDAEYLFFDEATSALDGGTEKEVMQAISNIGKCKTIVMIAHRLNTIKNCDYIYFMDKGKIVDSGTYQELIMRNDIFRKMAGK